MDMWAIILAIGAGFAAFTIIAKWTGTLDVILSVLQHIFNLFRQVAQFVVDHLPKPIKILLFLGLFALVASAAYNYSIGAQYVCSNPQTNTVVQVGWFQGVAFKLFSAGDLTEYYKAQATGTALVDSGNATPFLGGNVAVEVKNGSQLVTYTKGIIYPAGSSTTYDVYTALMPRGEIPDQTMSDGTFFQVKNSDMWDAWFGKDSKGNPNQRIRYLVCLDRQSETCTMVRAGEFGQTVSSCGTGNIFGSNMYTGSVGEIDYYLVANGDVTTLKAKYLSGAQGSIFGSGASASDCKFKTNSEIDDLVANGDLTGSQGGTVKQLIASAVPIQVNVVTDAGWWVAPLTYNLKLSGVANDGIFKVQTSGQVLTSAALEKNPNTGEFTDARKDLKALGFKDSTVVVSAPGDILRVVCAPTATDMYSTKPLVAGIDVLDPLVMTFFVLLGGLVSMYAYLKNLL